MQTIVTVTLSYTNKIWLKQRRTRAYLSIVDLKEADVCREIQAGVSLLTETGKDILGWKGTEERNYTTKQSGDGTVKWKSPIRANM